MAKITLNDRSIRRGAPDTGQVELWDSLRPGFGLRIAAGGARTYFVMTRINGKLVRRSIGKAPPPHITRDDTLAEGELWPSDAREKARLTLADMARGIDPLRPAATAPVKTPSTFGEVATAYFRDPAKRGGASLKSRGELQRKVRVDLKVWSDRPIAGISRADIRDMINAKHAASPVAANRLLALVRRIFRWAVREGIISANPAMDLEPTPEHERQRVLTLDELAHVWAGADALGYPYGPLIKLLILTAQRRNEVAALCWAEIDETVWRLPDDRTKRGKGHAIPLSPLAVRILSEIPKVGAKSQLVFTTGIRKAKPALGQKVEPAPVSGWSRMKTRLDKIIAKRVASAEAKANGVETFEVEDRHYLPQWTLHDIRRSVSTHLRDGDVMGDDRADDRLIISKILNHAEGGMTRLYDRYAADPEQRRALEAWAKRIERLCGLNVVPMGGKSGAA